jgi:hypothetical protein
MGAGVAMDTGAHDAGSTGALVKVGNVPLVWPVIGVLFARWAHESGRPAPVAPQAVDISLREA